MLLYSLLIHLYSLFALTYSSYINFCWLYMIPWHILWFYILYLLILLRITHHLLIFTHIIYLIIILISISIYSPFWWFRNCLQIPLLKIYSSFTHTLLFIHFIFYSYLLIAYWNTPIFLTNWFLPHSPF